MQKAIIIGATSGIGKALAKVLVAKGYHVGITGRREHLLKELHAELGSKVFPAVMDVRHFAQARAILRELIEQMGGLDLLIINSGTNTPNPALDWEPAEEIIEVNVMGFVALANDAIKYFLSHGKGHLVGISSIAGLRGGARAPAYNASKAFMSNYLAGLRQTVWQTPIVISDIRPGFVDTDMIRDIEGVFWRAPVETAAQQIFEAIQKKKKIVYITKRWWLVAQLFKFLPDGLFNRGYYRVVGERPQ